MICDACGEKLLVNEIQCRNCDTYLTKDKVKFHVLKQRNPVIYMLINCAGGLMFLLGAILLLMILDSLLRGIFLSGVLLLVGTVILALNNMSHYYDCPHCRAEKSILIKKKMIKSHCKYCKENINLQKISR